MTIHRMAVDFLSADPEMRATQIRYELRRLRDDCNASILLNPQDAAGQPIPPEAQGKFRSWGTDDAVPAGKFHLTVTLGE